MSDNIYDISKMLNDDMQNDLEQVTSMINDYFKRKYIDKLQNSLSDYRERLMTDPPREVKLLTAMKAFAPENKQDKLDKVIKAVTLVNTFNNATADYITKKNISDIKISASSNDPSIKPDGIYDIDESCTTQKNPMSIRDIMLILLMSGAL